MEEARSILPPRQLTTHTPHPSQTAGFDHATTLTTLPSLSFISFVGETTLSYKEGIWRMKKLKPEFKTTEELLNKFLEEYETLD